MNVKKDDYRRWDKKRSIVIKEIQKLDRKYGVSLVRSAFNRMIIRERLLKQLNAQKRDIEAKLKKVS